MTTPDVPYGFELSIEVPGTPEQVWAAIASANGISSWMLVTDLEEREGGAIEFHMGPDASSKGQVTAFDAPHRFAYVEPDWAALAGHPEAEVTPMATEFVVEAQDGGTCVVRVVSSAFGSGADWEQEFWADAMTGWSPMFDVLRLYLAHFPGQQVTPFAVDATVPAPAGDVMAAMRASLGGEVGAPFETQGATGTLELLGDNNVVVRLAEPLPGFLNFIAHSAGGDETWARVQGHIFSAEAGNWVEREQPAWQAWLEELVR